MSSLEEKIPAFSMWKMFNDTVPVIIKAECWEASIRKLASIIQSKEYSNILFIYNKEYNVTNEQYQEIQEKYKAFTVWLLGQFFYLLGNEKFSKVHDIIVDIQLSILDQLFNTQLDVFKELSKEYKKVLKLLVDYYKTANQKLVLQVFIPGNLEELNQELNLNPVFMEIQSPSKCTLILQKLLKFIEYMLTKNFTSCGFDEYTFSMLDHLLFLLSNSSEELQLEIADVFIELSTKNTDSINHPEIKSKFLLFSSLFEKFVYRTFNSREINKKNTTKCEQCLLKYLSSSEKTRHLFTNIPHITAFLFNITLNSRKGFAPSEELQIIAAKYVGNELKDNSIDYRLENLDFSNVAIIFSFYDQIYNDIGAIEGPCENLKIYSEDISKIWSRIYKIIINELAQKKCGEDCNISRFLHFFKSLSKMLVQINLNLIKSRNHPISFSYFDEIELMVNFIRKYLNHASNCQKSNTTFEDALHFFIAFISVTNSKNIHIIFNIIGFPILKTFVYKSENQFPINVIAEEKTIGDIKMIVRSFYRYLWTQNISRSISLKALNKLFLLISSKLITPKQSSVREIENLYMKICKLEFQSKNLDNMLLVIESIPHILTIFEDTDRILSQIINPAILLQISKVLESTLYTLHNVLCAVSLDFLKIVYWDDDRNCLQSTICCKKCTLQTNSDYVDDLIYQKFGQNAVAVKYNKIQVEHHMISSNLKHVLNSISKPCLDLKMAALGTLPSFSSHLLQFHSVDVTQIWVQLAADPNKEVRDKFTQVIEPIVTFCYDNPVLSEDIKSHIIRVIFSEMLDFTERSLKESNFDLQETLLCTLEAIGKVNSGCVWLETLKLFIHFIMTPTSKYNLDAVDRCFKLAENNKTSTTIIYSQNKKEICEVITQLCCAVESNLATSLEQVAHMLGFYGSKDFVNQECNYLLPFFVAKTVKMPAVKNLIQEMATMMDIDLGEMLSSKYGYIFIHIFLEDMPNEDIKQCMMFLENSTHSSGVSLRKRNFRIILNELLLNFHEKNDKVLLALRLLSNEDFENQGKANSIQEYLQSHFLGVLLYFDLKMISKNAGKDKFLLSLADLFKFMGSKHIMPLRFKIIAMLQTINYKNFPRLTCTIWDAFIRTCEIESLGPHLAVICVSLLPLIDHCTTEVNDMLNYLIIQNEIHMKNHIPDLFFVSHNKINLEIIMVIRKYLELFEKNNLKQKIQRFLKYIMHESTEVRIQGLKQLKTYLEQDREALDQMILDYNGIDATIVELIDVLTTGCREKDETLKLACGDLFGELGAIEPSHLPRRYTQEDTSFCFYINEDTFIVNSLNELIKAFQAEKNTQSMDRYALAIQETLKGYEISPDPHSNKHYLWVQFPDTQREVMLPLLSSRYMIAQPVLATNLTTPIYGSTSGSTFQAWLYNWTCSLISSLPDERKTLLKVYLPSMKQDQRILMHFMPHILLHALLEGSDRIAEKCLVEIQTITSSITDNRAILNVRPDINTETPTVTPEKIKQIQCTKVVFLLLDYLDRWVREWQWQKGMEGSTEKHFKIITCFLNKLCKLQLAKCNYQSGEYPRALMYLEDYITDSNGELHNNLSFFAEIYAQLEEPDGVDGVMALQPNEPSLEQRILALEVAGKLADATNCYERMPQPLQLQHIQGLTQCYLGLDNVNTALYFVKGALNSQQEFNNMLLEMQAEPLWRLGQYDELNTLIKDPKLSKNKSWGVQVGKALLHIKNGERNYFKSTIDGLMMQQVFSFSATSLEEGAYKSGYGCVSKLHALNELQQVEKIIFDLLDSPNNREYAENVIKKLSKEWSLRIKVVQESVGIIEPILCLRRVSLNLAKHIAEEKFQTAVPYLNSLIGESWLLSAKTARSAGMHQQAYTYSIKAEEYAPSTLFLDKAKLHWLREEHEQALHCLRRGVEVIMPEGSSPDMLTIEQRKLCAEAKLLMATYNEELSNVDIDVNRQIFKESVEIFKEWEKSLVCLAHFLDKLFQSYSSAEQDSRGSDLQLQMINYFGKSLQYGTHYIYQSMPRMLSIWFDYGTRLLEVGQNSVKEERKLILLRMTKLIDCFLERLPSYVFLTAFSQLVSRICHPQKEVYIMLKSIIIKLVQQYPQQSLWMVISVIKSSYSVRSKRCAEILCDPRLKTTSLTRLVRDFTSLAEKLIELCNKEIPADANTASVNSLLRTLPRLLAKDDFSEIMMPTFKLRKLIIPNPDFSNAQHNPFPNAYVYIVGIEDEISVLQSLQKPRKIALKGSDGKRYIFMLKPKDDLRKDFRLMEFNDIVNHLLAREGEARQRRLNIRLYSVAPLNEECGLIEWVHNLVGLRPVLLSLYKQKGYIMKAKELRDACCNIRDSLEKKRDVFLKKLIPRHPPILGEWFRKTFPDAQSWLTARTAYVRTTAVMSMAGYMLGLGDRHGENIQLDSTCGDVVHVDFNCLFNKGEKFDWPERVPFRLTHNMVAAMGPLGVDGIFRKSCACTLRVLRDNSNTLMSIVAPFVYDPLVSWPRHSSLPNIHNSERTNEEAVDHIKNIELRLKGSVKTRNRTVTMPLSVEGQTNYLIKEAVSIDNLCQMYLGWGAYL
ncbi:serine/threonine-protein kinase ATR-like [Diorhabda carinulata]|uniref:serine/threonine-protein kinase ATR-like n=1 Tax=Diorhabda carinulata TaxID=1163345 RepID=UPI0025A05AE2|nr:serine/threonine-protein kinase ATR-like [Diorhabda carinulata]